METKEITLSVWQYVRTESFFTKVMLASALLKSRYKDLMEKNQSNIRYNDGSIEHNNKRSEHISKRLFMTKEKKNFEMEALSKQNQELSEQNSKLEEKNANLDSKILVLDDFMAKYRTSSGWHSLYDYYQHPYKSVVIPDDPEYLRKNENDEGFKRYAQVVIDKFEETFSTQITEETKKLQMEENEKNKKASATAERLANFDKILDN